MNFNLLETLNSTVGKAMLEQAPGLLGESKDKSESAIHSVMGALSGSLVSKASTPDGANSLFNMVNSSQIDTGLLGNLTGLFAGGNNTTSLTSLGASLLPQILGKANSNELATHIGQNTGIQTGSAMTMLSMAAPLVLGVLKQHIASNNMNASGFSSLMNSQSGFLKHLLPSWLTGALGIGGMLMGAVTGTAGKAVDVAGGAAKAVGGAALDAGHLAGGAAKAVGGAALGAGTMAAGAVTGTAKAGGGLLKKLLPWLLLAALALFLLKMCGGSKTPESMPAPVASKAAVVVPAAPVATDPAKFSLVNNGGKLSCSGSVSTANATGMLDAAKKAFTDAPDCKLEGGASVKDATWAAKSPELLALLKDNPGASISVDGDKVTVSGVKGDGKGLLDKLKGLFGDGMNVSLFDAKAATDTANQGASAALAALTATSSPDDLVKALNMQVINFASGSAKVAGDSKPLLDASAKAIQLITAAKLEVGGHTDNKGHAESNQKLSDARAKAVMNYLVAHGVKADQLTAKGYGQEKPAADNATDDGRFKNRRIEYSVNK